ncbi:peptidyl-prolyl cis-trans isomerase [Gemmatimonadota bacterium]
MAVLTMVLMAAAGCNNSSPAPVIAQVGDATLSVEDLRNAIPEETLRTSTRDDLQDYINQWVREELLFQAAESMGYDRDDRVTERVAEARRGILVDIFLEDELDMRPFIAEDQIAEFYQNNLETFVRIESEVAVEILWFDESADGEAARRAALEGRPFSEMVGDTSFGVVAADIESEYLTRRELGEELGDAVFAMTNSDLSSLIPAGGSYALVRVIDRQDSGTTRTLEEVRNEIIMRQTSDLWEMKLDELLRRLLEQSSISINAEAGLVLIGGGSDQ